MVKDKCMELALEGTWFNPSYCCSVVANLLHTCNPPEAGTLTYSVLFIYALPGRERLDCYPACVCACMNCTLYVWEEATACTNVSRPNTWLSECLPEVVGQILW